jgi:hypothetical protein
MITSMVASTGLYSSLYNITYTILSCVFYSWLDNDLKKRCGTFGPRAMSTFHAIVVSILSILHIYNSFAAIYFSILIRWISTGYFVIDLFNVTADLKRRISVFNVMIFIHHFISILWIRNFPLHLAYMTAHGMLTEMSTPFVNICWYLKKSSCDDLYKSRLDYKVSGFIAWILFLSLRIINYSVVLWNFIPQVGWITILGSLTVWTFNILWFPKVTKTMLFP